jgi:DoxX-like protein
VSVTISDNTARRGTAITFSLWVAQVPLALAFGTAGVMKTFMPVVALVANGINYAAELPLWLLRFIGVAELSGAVGVVLPALTRIKPRLTPIAALGFVTIQVLAIGFHALRGELAMALPR